MDRNELVLSQFDALPKIASKYAGQGLEEDDLIQEGALGLIRAAEKFDPERGEFQFYAWSWANQFMQRALDNMSRTVRVPVYTLTKARKESACVEESNVELDTLRKVPSAFDTLEVVSDCLLYEIVRDTVDGLPERDKDIVIRRYGFDGDDTQTLQEIGDVWSLTRERIRQLDKAARSRIRSALAEFDYTEEEA